MLFEVDVEKMPRHDIIQEQNKALGAECLNNGLSGLKDYTDLMKQSSKPYYRSQSAIQRVRINSE